MENYEELEIQVIELEDEVIICSLIDDVGDGDDGGDA